MDNIGTDIGMISKKHKLHVETTVSRKTIVKKYKKSSKTLKRRLRRKRNKRTYFKALEKNRNQRKTEDLCCGIQEFSVFDMEMTQVGDYSQLPKEVTEWHTRDQIAYWKSRALSLEIENRMLHEHLRHVYAQQVEYSSKNNEWKEVSSSDNLDKDGKKQKSRDSESGSLKKSSALDTVKEIGKVLPKTPQGKNRLEEMIQIYGDKAQKIMGMETANQLNYEKLLEENLYPYWPNLPIKL